MARKAITEKTVRDEPEGAHLWPSIDRLVRNDREAMEPGRAPVPGPGIRGEVRMGRAQNESGLVWVTTVFMVIFHIGTIAALFFFSWTNLIVAVVLYIFAINFGIGMGYHRLLVHRGYQVPKVIEYFLATCGTLSLEGGPIAWVATHRIHHQHSDKEGDPHTPHDGAWWAHAGWIVSGRSLPRRSRRNPGTSFARQMAT